MSNSRYKLCINDPDSSEVHRFVVFEKKQNGFFEYYMSSNEQEVIQVWMDSVGLQLGGLYPIYGYNMHNLVEK